MSALRSSRPRGPDGSSSTPAERTGTTTITDRDRRHIYTRLEATIGPETRASLATLTADIQLHTSHAVVGAAAVNVLAVLGAVGLT